MTEFWKLYATIIGGEFNVGVSTLAKVAILCKATYAKTRDRLARCKYVYDKYKRRLAFGYYIKLLSSPIYKPELPTRTKIIPVAELMNNPIGIIPMIGLFSEEFMHQYVPVITAVKILLRAVTPVVTCLYIGHEPVHTMYGRIIGNYDNPRPPTLAPGTNTAEIDYEQPGEYLMDLLIPFNFNPICIEESVCPANSIQIAFNSGLTAETIGNEVVYGIYHNTDFIVDYISHIIVNYRAVPRDSMNWSNYGVYTTSNIRSGMILYSLVRDKYETAKKEHDASAREQERINKIMERENLSK